MASITPVKAEPESAPRIGAYSWYVGWMLLFVTVISLLDRKALIMLAEPIKRDLQLSDTQLGLLTGGLFTLVYAVASFPLARLADRFSRARIIGICMIVWSVLTAMGGFATGFYTLAASRVGVALGEAGASPASHALLANHFPASARGRAYGILLAGGPLGILLGLSLAGWLNDLFDWRIALLVLALPGIVFGLIVMMTVRDKSSSTSRDQSPIPFFDAVRVVIADPVLRNVWFGAATIFVMHGATNALLPSYLMRNFGLSASTVGTSFGITLGLAGFVGSLASGLMTDRLGASGAGWPLRIFAICLLFIAPLSVARLLVADYTLILVLVGVEVFLTSLYAGPTFTVLQARLNDRYRALGTAVFLFGINGVGASFGPLMAGVISDFVASQGGGSASSLRFGLLSVTPFTLLSMFFYFRAARHMARQSER